MGDRCETPEGKGKGPKIHFDNTHAMLNDLARGQGDMLTSIQQMNLSAQMLQHNMISIGVNATGGPGGSRGHQGCGASGSSGSQGGASTNPSLAQAYTSSGRIPRPLYPQFQT
jgi:hypothetical protein